MSPDTSLQLLSQLLWKAVLISAPLLISVLLVGVLISILQAVTQIQEMTLTFVPKLVVCVVVLVVAGPWMLGQLSSYAAELIRAIPRLI